MNLRFKIFKNLLKIFCACKILCTASVRANANSKANNRIKNSFASIAFYYVLRALLANASNSCGQKP